MEDIIKVFRKVNCFYGKRLILDCKRVEIVSYEAFMVIIARIEKAFHNGKSIILRNICRENVKEIMIGRNIDGAIYHNYADLNKYGGQPIRIILYQSDNMCFMLIKQAVILILVPF